MEGTLLSLLLQSTALLALAGFMSALAARRSSAALRHLIWTAALLSLLLLPLVNEAGKWLPTPQPVVSLFLRDSITVFGSGEEGLQIPVGQLLIWGWAAVASFLVVRLIFSTVSAQLFVNRAAQIQDSHWVKLPNGCELRRSAETETPLAFGVHRPVIVVPMDSDHWTAERWRAVLLHELAHIERFDVLTQWMGSLVCAIYWFQPLTWFAASHMRFEREQAADDRVLESGILASDYASHLIALAGKLAPATTLPMAGRQMSTRVESILDAVRRRGRITAWQKFAALAMTLILLAPTTLLRARTELSASIEGKRIKIGGDKQSTKLIYKLTPRYPSEAKRQRIQGAVQLKAVISADGSPRALHVIESPDPLLTQSALAAVWQWRYSPTHLNGIPVEVETSISVNYTLTK